ncbi:hypothetical protein DLAC_01979 [Tieghemostelium lacteum]|uniref:MACPF domain-containing protein n=1 Tax=Tieghemostelium lacteum TaxID=361077 RepID=A0A152A582_TIELA|nr:hypothetical protein DLAC_01979 [Tieghemostelium lacteum]|eukprot:KYR01390.1 hypothetical protein DLAC_01979 [Tieghemostelium lacteum]
MKQKLFVLLLLSIFLVFGGQIAEATKRYYVDSKSTCSSNSGTSSCPFKSIADSLKITNSFSCNDWNYDVPEVYIKVGNYTGINNRELTIINPVNIKSWNGNSNNTIIDCQGISYGFKVIKATQVIFNGISIVNCNSNYGAGLYISQTPTSISEVRLAGNIASVGAGLYAKSSTISILNSVIERNNAVEEGGGAFFENSKATLINSRTTCNTLKGNIASDYHLIDSTLKADTINTTHSQVSCIDSKFTLNNKNNVCGNKGTLCPLGNGTTPTPGTGGNPTCPASTGTCGDGICDFQTESCLNCAKDCNNCSFSGMKFSSYKGCHPLSLNQSCLVSSVVLTEPVVTDFLESECLVAGVLESYFLVTRDGLYTFKVDAANLGVKLWVNGKVYINAYFIQEKFETEYQIALLSDRVNRFKVEFFSNGPSVRNITISWKPFYDTEFSLFDKSFYSLNVCGDRILDTNETCNSDFLADVSIEKPISCGDGICNEDVSTCILDCYLHITETCAASNVVDNHIPTGFTTGVDTLGLLIDNQMLWQLPGVEKFSMGVNVLNGESSLSPLFYFGYCNSQGSNLVQDNYRGLVYDLPDEISAVPYPRCSYDLTATSFSSSSSMAESMASKFSYSVEASVSFGKGGVGGSANAAYQEETSVKTARELESKRTGSLVSTEVKCYSAKVELVKNTFHPIFLQDIGSANDAVEMLPFLEKYGTYYYKNAVMGGKLSQISIMDSSFESQTQSQELEQHSKISFSGSVKAPMFKANFDYKESNDYQVSFDSHNEYEQKSSRSTLITHGGAPASFNPSGDGVSNYDDWASSVDLLPVPVDYKLARIYDLIPKDWKSKNGSTYIHDLWDQAEGLLSYNLAIETKKSNYTVYLYFDAGMRLTGSPDTTLIALGSNPYNTITANVNGYYSYKIWETCTSCNNGHQEEYCCNYEDITSPFIYETTLPQMNDIPTLSIKKSSDTGDSTSIHGVIQTTYVTVFNWGNGHMHLFNINNLTTSVTTSQTYYMNDYLVSFIAHCQHGNDEPQLRGRRRYDGKDPEDESGNAFLPDPEWDKLEIILYGNMGTHQYVMDMTDDIFPDVDDTRKNVLIRIPKSDKHIGRITGISLRAGNSLYWGALNYPNTRITNLWVSQVYCGFYDQCTSTSTDQFNFVSITNEEWILDRYETNLKGRVRLYGLRDL